MSYSKIIGNPNTIRFRYLSDDLFSIVMLKTMYRARTIKNDKGESLIDDYAMSQAERDAFDTFLITSANLVFKTVLKMTKGVTSAISIDTAETTGNTDLIILDNAAFNENILDYVDTLIKDTIVFKVMSEWYKTCGLDEEFAKIEANYNQNKKELINGLFELRKPLIS